MTHTILIAEDEPVQRRMLTNVLTKKLGYEVIVTQNGQEALARVQASNIDDISAVLLDLNMPELDGFAALKAIRKSRPDLPVIILTGSDDTSNAVLAIKEGASDFLVKPTAPAQLDVAIKNAIRLSALSHELAKLKRTKDGAGAFTDIIGHRGGMAGAIAYGRKAAACDVPVLLMGETGTGKEMFARTIHGESRRAGAPFVALHCSAMSHNTNQLLFGDDRPAIPNAPAQAQGKIRAAEGGTLFLDDITELSPDAQVRLLRVLQQKEIEPAGVGRPIKINVRIISATDRDIRGEVQAGRFREDLYFRLNILPITLPSLRDRTEDILPLAEHFIQRLSISDRLPIKTLEADAKEYLLRNPWPGNVRELEGLIHRALVLSDGETIERAVIEEIYESHVTPTPITLPTTITEQTVPRPLHLNLRHADGRFKTMDEIEDETIRTTLAHYEQNIANAAEALAIAKSTFYRKIKATP